MRNLFDHVFATYRPPERERDPRYAGAIGRRTLFQVAGIIALQEGRRAGELALMPRDLLDGTVSLFPHRVPLSHVVDVETAPPEVAG